MSGFLYFIEGLGAPLDSELESRGLAGVFGRRADGRLDVGPYTALDPSASGVETPTGSAGLLIGDRPYDSETQTWYPAGDPPFYHIGQLKDCPPGPEDLERETICRGKSVRLGDGRKWMIPTATQLPRRRFLTAEGGTESRVIDKFEHLMALAVEVWDNYDKVAKVRPEFLKADLSLDDIQQIAAAAGVMSGDREREIIAAVIGCNYAIDLFGIDAIGLLDDECETEVLRVLMDWDSAMKLHAEAIDEAQKKNVD